MISINRVGRSGAALCSVLVVALMCALTLSQGVDDASADQWVAVEAGGFGSVDNSAVGTLAPFDGFLYAGTYVRRQSGRAAEIWKAAGSGVRWIDVTPPWPEAGLIQRVTAMAMFKDALYVGTEGYVGESVCRGGSNDGVPCSQCTTCEPPPGSGSRNECTGGGYCDHVHPPQIWRTLGELILPRHFGGTMERWQSVTPRSPEWANSCVYRNGNPNKCRDGTLNDKPCDEPSPAVCQGGPNNGARCHETCGGYPCVSCEGYPCEGPVCVGGPHDGQDCTAKCEGGPQDGEFCVDWCDGAMCAGGYCPGGTCVKSTLCEGLGAITSMAVFDGRLYAVKGKFANRALEVWYTENGETWHSTGTPLLDPHEEAIWKNENGYLIVFDDALYMTTGQDLAGGGGGCQVWMTTRPELGYEWTPLVATEWESAGARPDGLGSESCGGFISSAVFKGSLYVGSVDHNGRRLWRFDGSGWEDVTPNVGDFDSHSVGIQVLSVFGNRLFLGDRLSPDLSLWATRTGEDPSSWVSVRPASGFGESVGIEAVTALGPHLFVGTTNNEEGGQVWRKAPSLADREFRQPRCPLGNCPPFFTIMPPR